MKEEGIFYFRAEPESEPAALRIAMKLLKKLVKTLKTNKTFEFTGKVFPVNCKIEIEGENSSKR